VSSAHVVATVLIIVVRISESLARMQRSDEATIAHVKEALRLFQVSTFQAATSPWGEGLGSAEFADSVRKVPYVDFPPSRPCALGRDPIGQAAEHWESVQRGAGCQGDDSHELRRQRGSESHRYWGSSRHMRVV
jgi:hypothetical protein